MPVQSHAVSSYVGTKTDCSTMPQCNMMATTCNFAESVLDANLIPQYSGDGHTPHNSACVNLSSTSSSIPISSSDLISHSKALITADIGIQDSNLNFTSPNQFYDVDGQMEEGYADVQDLNYTCLPGMNSLSTQINSCSTNASAYINVSSMRYDTMEFRCDSHQDHQMAASNVSHQDHPIVASSSVVYHVASNNEQLPDSTNSEHYIPHHCNLPSEYQCTASVSNNLVPNLPIPEPPQVIQDPLPGDDAASQEMNSTDVYMDTTKSTDVLEKIKVDIGIQCEVGSETLQALLEEEEGLDESAKGDESVQELNSQSDAQKSM